mmetsp:Transcript_9102/g.19440  ORF Transcript_9102/g.19440 Transcript_9102/m.19440 type:complete len:178 (+) Transcript_9102:25-558(+)|eukprot:CAMPEP_0171442320 /NCGR_PEP_ID=MMETSP0881-20121228/27815_1 /TAXON_ID=67004 /ORGANISM="Thalassiosira weissflogii, Strain CCMP1336" /LENGTH=177 /DNA_ID=CAMNT_0011965367 /DNA_START=13 /DNA_END=546 /DNA_ORIENTATION=+
MITKTLILLLIIINISISDGKIFEAKLRAGKQAVTDYYDGDDVNELETKDGDTYYQCQKNCITKLDDNKCKSCTVREDDPDRPVFCRDGTLPLPCMNKCCIQIETPNERITGKQRVHDFEGDENEGNRALLVAYSCKKRCIAKKDACGSCALDVDSRVFCTDGKIPSACLEQCCKMA